LFEYIHTWLTAKKGEKGQDLAEYAILIGLIALVVLLAVTFLGTAMSTVFSRLGSEVNTWW